MRAVRVCINESCHVPHVFVYVFVTCLLMCESSVGAVN